MKVFIVFYRSPVLKRVVNYLLIEEGYDKAKRKLLSTFLELDPENIIQIKELKKETIYTVDNVVEML